jgi:hypothetical protein
MIGRSLLPGVVPGLLAPREVARRHLRAGVSVDSFFAELDRLGVRYAVLRWFETLPEVDPGEDIDVLVADEDLPALRSLVRSHRVAPTRQTFDVYSVTGLPGSDYRGIPYLSPTLAARLLERSVLLRGRYRVPCPEDHFDSMAYHAVYHKGLRSGLPAGEGAAVAATGAEHDYADVLAGLAAQVPVSVPLTLEGLDAYLAAKGLRPPLDTLEKLAETNPWLRDHLETAFGPADAGLPGLAVFVVREQAAGLVDRLGDELLREGWQPMETIRFDAATAERVRTGVRGGNWGAGPWPVGGGGPVAYVVAFDLAATTGDGGPGDTERVTVSKLAIRRRLLAATPSGARFNPLHSSDNPRQALDYLELVADPGLVDRLRSRIAGLHADMRFPFPVVELLPSHRRRAVTAVVDHPEFGESVCKLFYPSAHRYLDRELRARTQFGHLPEVPALLAAEGSWLLSPRYSDTAEHVRRPLADSSQVQLTPRTSRALVRLARELHEQRAYLLDLTPLNLMSDPAAGLKVIDWEFLQDLDTDPSPLSTSPTVSGRATGRDVDSPLGVSAGGSVTTVFSWQVTGLPTGLLLRSPTALLAPVAEVGMVLASAVRSLRAAVRGGRAGAERTLRQTVRGSVRFLERRRGTGFSAR